MSVTRWLRIGIPIVLIMVWFIFAGLGGTYFGKISEVSTNDFTAYLPTHSDAAEVQKLQSQFVGSDETPAVVLYVRDSGLSAADCAAVSTAADTFSKVPGVSGAPSSMVLSQDGKAAYVFVPVAADGNAPSTVTNLRSQVAATTPGGVTAYVTGPAGYTADLVDAFSGIDGILLVVALIAVFVILVVVYRSPLLPIIVLATASFALCISIFVVWWIAKTGWIQLNGQIQGILFILVIGAATDYSLLYVARYRDALRDCQSAWDATWAALKGSWQPILASGGTVIAALSCLLLSDLTSNKALGPIASIGIVFALLSAFTFLPSILLVTGRVVFWPLRPLFGSQHHVFSDGMWGKVSRGVSKKPRTIWVTCAFVLLVASLGFFQLKADGVSQSDLILGASDAKSGQEQLAIHFPGGSGSPALIVGPEQELDAMASTVLQVSGVNSLTVLSHDSPAGVLLVTSNGIQHVGPPGTPTLSPTIVDGQILLQATLNDAADSLAAEQTVQELRNALGTIPGDVRVGGVTATSIDTQDASIHDRNLIIPLILVVILLILMMLLRAIVAPIFLVLTVALSFTATLGVSALVFNNIFHFPGADPAVPLYSFVFLVALGVDYNIFLMTRVREESLLTVTRQGILRGLAVTGGVITSAGLVLAATFAALGVIPVLFLVQVAFIVAFGVLLDTFLVRALLVPALSYDIGRHIWWPSRLSRNHGVHESVHSTPQ